MMTEAPRPTSILERNDNRYHPLSGGVTLLYGTISGVSITGPDGDLRLYRLAITVDEYLYRVGRTA